MSPAQDRIVEALTKLTPEERKAVFFRFCLDCGGSEPYGCPCQGEDA